MEKVTAVVLAAGRGTRMNSEIQKQYLPLNGRPLICYALEAFEHSDVDEIVLVCGSGELEYCRKEIAETGRYSKVKQIVEGGAERYDSVYAGLKAAAPCDYVLIHDGARPFLTVEVIRSAIDGARKHRACVVGMPVKDTIKIADESGFAASTPDRRYVWAVQTPQAFAFNLVMEAYSDLLDQDRDRTGITDDAMVVERMKGIPSKMIEGSYSNIKVTTPEDMVIAEALCRQYFKS